jgi:hypothetical protein
MSHPTFGCEEETDLAEKRKKVVPKPIAASGGIIMNPSLAADALRCEYVQ